MVVSVLWRLVITTWVEASFTSALVVNILVVSALFGWDVGHIGMFCRDIRHIGMIGRDVIFIGLGGEYFGCIGIVGRDVGYIGMVLYGRSSYRYDW